MQSSRLFFALSFAFLEPFWSLFGAFLEPFWSLFGVARAPWNHGRCAQSGCSYLGLSLVKVWLSLVKVNFSNTEAATHGFQAAATHGFQRSPPAVLAQEMVNLCLRCLIPFSERRHLASKGRRHLGSSDDTWVPGSTALCIGPAECAERLNNLAYGLHRPDRRVCNV